MFEDELEEKKIAEKIVTHDEIKNTAWDNLLEYLGRSEASAKKQYIENLTLCLNLIKSLLKTTLKIARLF